MITEAGGKAIGLKADVTKAEEIKRTGDEARRKFGDVTILINNAGICFCKSLEEIKDNQADLTYRVNVMAHGITVREFLPAMKKKDHGHIVTIASIAGTISVPN